MLLRVLSSRFVARTAVAALTIGLFALAALAAWSTVSMARTTSWVREVERVGAYWGEVFSCISQEYEGLADYVRADTPVGREPLESSIGSAEVSLSWLERNGGPVEAATAADIHKAYRDFSESLRRLVRYGREGDRAAVESGFEMASLDAASLRKRALANYTRLRFEVVQYLKDVDGHTRRFRVASAVIFGIDLLQLFLCGGLLLVHQRSVERQARDSRYRALHDGLTGVANRTLLIDRMEEALRAATRHGEAVALLLLDLDRFKEVNDTLGHHYGDLLLCQVANRMCSVVRDCDTVARLGGDEFAVLLPRAGSTEVGRDVSERMLAALRRPVDLDGTAVDISGSIGVAAYPTHSHNATELLQHADIAMYTAKRGHLGIAVYDPNADRHALVGELRHALDAGELILHYQPKARTGDGKILGVEALVRWRHPTRGLMPPGEFIALAEENDLIEPLTYQVLAMALRQHGEWRDQGLTTPIAVNIATQCLLDPTFVPRVAAVLAEHGTEPGHVTFEITESAFIADPARSTAVLQQLRDLGVRLALDDFGTGYSAMAYLQTMPLNELKIDRRFITAVGTSPADAAIVQATLQLAHALGLEVVAEGVEDEPTWSALDEMGCDVVQGYHLSRPIPPQEFIPWMARGGHRVPTPVP